MRQRGIGLGRNPAAQALVLQIAEGTWQPRFQGLVSQAKGQRYKTSQRRTTATTGLDSARSRGGLLGHQLMADEWERAVGVH